MVEAACKLMLGDSDKAIEIIREHLSKNFSSSSRVIKFPILESIREDLEKINNSLRN